MNISSRHQKIMDEMIPKKDQQGFVDGAIEKALTELRAGHAESVEVFVDGGSRGNPGPSGGGYGIYRGGKLAHKGKQFFGRLTNNQAEYLALRLALRECYDRFPDLAVKCYMDSELVVKQMNGEYKVKNAALRPLHEEVSRIAGQFKRFSIHHVPREQNKLADKMANEAMDEGGR